jgi:two-component system, OmpR family, phosphate regulon sensor histidine kinase PhoR
MLTKCKISKPRWIMSYLYAMKANLYRTVIVTTLVALTGMLGLQIYWFVHARRIQEKQFDTTVNLALRSIADKLLDINGNSSKRIFPINQTSSNSFYVEVNEQISYELLDSLVKEEFVSHDIYSAFQLSVYDHKANSLMFGNFYKDGALTKEEAACINRESAKAAMDFAVVFPDKQSDIIGAMNIWIFTAFTFLLILIVFGFLLLNLSRQKKLAEIKAEFMNNMTHELQTPIANIEIASEVLRSNSNLSSDKAARYATIIHEENQRLKFHMQQVLQIARMERGELTLERKPIDLNLLVKDVIRNFEIRLHKRSGHISESLQATRAVFTGDPFHLANIFYNLLDNADKYSPEKPEITISSRDEGNGILISIADKGIGIKHDVQKFIFDKFYRATTGNQHDVKGFGLGLTYVQQIVQAHNGTIKVESEENKGSRFDLFFANA